MQWLRSRAADVSAGTILVAPTEVLPKDFPAAWLLGHCRNERISLMEVAEAELDFSSLPSVEEMAASTRLLDPESDRGNDRVLTKRWRPLYLHPKQREYYYSDSRFNIVPAGRRSGKTEIAKRRLVRKALREYRFEDARYIAAAPTNAQARRIYWRDLIKLVPQRFILGGYAGIMHSSMTIPLVNGNEIVVMGMDVPERVEGSPIAHILMDEYANMLARVWDDHVSPALMDTQGTADFIGVPEGRNHYYDRVKDAESDPHGEWKVYSWWTEEILPLYLGHTANRKDLPPDLAALDAKELGKQLAQREIESAKRRMDPLSYEQEMRASFVTFQGRVYYGFDSNIHAAYRLPYRKDQPLIFMFDFNTAPGVCAVGQEFPMNFIPGQPEFTGIIGEVYIPKNSNTELVCKALIDKWKGHAAPIKVYGDATGGQKRSSAVSSLGSNDWAIVENVLRSGFGDRIRMHVPRANPSERARINAVNSRCKAIDGTVRLRVCPVNAKHTVIDFEGVTYKEGVDVIDKDSDKKLTHLTDAIGYYIHKEFPVGGKGAVSIESW